MNSITLNIRLRYVVLFLGSIITTIATIWLNKLGLLESNKDVLEVISVGVALTTLVYTAMAVQLSTKIRAEDLRLKKVEIALDFMKQSAQPEMVRAIRIIADIKKEMHNLDNLEAIKLIEASSEKTEALILNFNYFERLGLIVRLNAADENALKEYFSVPVRRIWYPFNQWIIAKRAEVQTPDLFSEFEFLANRWK